MGRYDRLRVFKNGLPLTPKQVMVYSAAHRSFISLGMNDGDEQNRQIYVYKDGAQHRVTKNKVHVVEITERYSSGRFSIKPATGYQFRTQKSPGATFMFRGTFRKTKEGAVRLYWTGRKNRSSGMYFEIWWESDGRLGITCCNTGITNGTGTTIRLDTTNAVGLNQWVYIEVICDFGSTSVRCNFNGVTTSKSLWNGWVTSQSDCIAEVGSDGIDYKGNLTVQGCSYSGATNRFFEDMTYAEGATDKRTAVNNVSIQNEYDTWN